MLELHRRQRVEAESGERRGFVDVDGWQARGRRRGLTEPGENQRLAVAGGQGKENLSRDLRGLGRYRVRRELACRAVSGGDAAGDYLQSSPPAPQGALRRGWLRPLAVPMLVLGVLYGAAQPETVPTLGLSTAEQGLSLVLFAAGALAGLLLLTLWAHQLRMALAGLSEDARERWAFRAAYVSAVLAGGVFFYRLSAPYWSGDITPAYSAT